ncbi:MAG: M48 family metallopeptidase [Mobilicoccus sp.]|nr:M48 family metallopeptidase [Mobilicoccus sp.]
MAHPTRPHPPALTRFTTTLPWARQQELRHPAELPWLAVAVLTTLTVFIGSTALYLSGYRLEGLFQQGMVLALGAPIFILLARAYIYGQQRSKGVRVSPTQFPDAYRMLAEASLSAGMRRMPDAFVVSGNGVLNAFAAGHGHRRYVMLHSDMFEIGGETRDPDALRFVIGHEVGHLAAGHSSYWRQLLTTVFDQIPVLGPALSRAQEYTADNYGYAYCPQGAAGAIATMAAGKYLNHEVQADEYVDRAVTDRSLFIWVVNLLGSHPILIWRGHALRHRDRAGSLFFAPRAGVGAQPSLPVPRTATADWADPAQALAFLDAHPQGEDVFGGVRVARRAEAIRPTPCLDGGHPALTP